MMPLLDNARRNSKGDHKMPEPKMPRALSIPTEPPVAQQPERIYSEDVLNFLQQNADNKHRIVELEAERDDWRRKALAAQDECRRLEVRMGQDTKTQEQALARLTTDRDRRLDELTAARDEYKLRLARFETKIGVQGKAVIDLANSISKTILETMDELKGERGGSDVAGSAGLAAIADVLEQEALEPPMPRVVTAGPDTDGS